MKKALLSFSIMIMLVAITSCKKSDSSSVLVGNWSRSTIGFTATLDITDNSHFSYSQNYGGTVYSTSGTYTIAGSQVTFLETAITSGCPNVPGNYSYAVSGNAVTFGLVSDACTSGRTTVVVGNWSK